MILAAAAMMLPMISYGMTQESFTADSQKPSYNKFVIGYDLKSAGAEKDTSLSDRNYYHDIYGTYNITKNFYMTATLKLDDNGKAYYSGTYGVHDHAGYLRPYAEVSYDSSDDKAHYDVGASVNLTDRFSPFIEMDDFLSQSDKSIGFGATSRLWKDLYVKASYFVVDSDHANNFSVGMYYKI